MAPVNKRKHTPYPKSTQKDVPPSGNASDGDVEDNDEYNEEDSFIAKVKRAKGMGSDQGIEIKLPTKQLFGTDYPEMGTNDSHFFNDRWTYRVDHQVNIRRCRWKGGPHYVYFGRMAKRQDTGVDFLYKWGVKAVYIPQLIQALQGIQAELDAYDEDKE